VEFIARKCDGLFLLYGHIPRVFQNSQKKVDGGDGDADRPGDCWIYIAKKADTKLHLAHSTASVKGYKPPQIS